jgi:hypothetical protein
MRAETLLLEAAGFQAIVELLGERYDIIRARDVGRAKLREDHIDFASSPEDAIHRLILPVDGDGLLIGPAFVSDLGRTRDGLHSDFAAGAAGPHHLLCMSWITAPAALLVVKPSSPSTIVSLAGGAAAAAFAGPGFVKMFVYDAVWLA